MNEDAGVPDPRSGRSLGARELKAAHEIAQAFLAATQPVEVYRLALARVTSMVGADFAAVFLRDERDGDLLRPACLFGWPQASARYVGQMRIRTGKGPTGRAVAENSPVEVCDIFDDQSLQDWHEPARELGFASMITMPLATQTTVNGAVSFYFAEPHVFTVEERSLLRLISEQLAATTTRARVFDDLRVENERLRRDGEHLAAAIREAEVEARRHDILLSEAIAAMASEFEATGNGPAAVGSRERLAGLVEDLGELLDLRLGRSRLDVAPRDATRLAREAADRVGAPPAGVEFSIVEHDAIVALTTDGARVIRILASFLAEAFDRTARGSIVMGVQTVEGDAQSWVEWEIVARGMGVNRDRIDPRNRPGSDRLASAVVSSTVEALGGSIQEHADPGNGWSRRLRLPLRSDPSERPTDASRASIAIRS